MLPGRRPNPVFSPGFAVYLPLIQGCNEPCVDVAATPCEAETDDDEGADHSFVSRQMPIMVRTQKVTMTPVPNQISASGIVTVTAITGRPLSGRS